MDALGAARALRRAGAGVIQLPVDLAVADSFAADAARRTVSVEEIPAAWMALDIGAATVAHFANRLAGARTVLWNGPLGVFEFPAFAHGTNAIAEMLAGLSHATTIIGGGDSAAAARQAGTGRAHLPCEHRRRRLPGVSGGKNAARRGGSGR